MLIKWFVYILRCNDKSFYIGISPNPQLRVIFHNSGKGSKYLRLKLPVSLLYQELYSNKSVARKREIQLKGWSRKKKDMLIKRIIKDEHYYEFYS